MYRSRSAPLFRVKEAMEDGDILDVISELLIVSQLVIKHPALARFSSPRSPLPVQLQCSMLHTYFEGMLIFVIQNDLIVIPADRHVEHI